MTEHLTIYVTPTEVIVYDRKSLYSPSKAIPIVIYNQSSNNIDQITAIAPQYKPYSEWIEAICTNLPSLEKPCIYEAHYDRHTELWLDTRVHEDDRYAPGPWHETLVNKPTYTRILKTVADHIDTMGIPQDSNQISYRQSSSRPHAILSQTFRKVCNTLNKQRQDLPIFFHTYHISSTTNINYIIECCRGILVSLS